MNLYRCQVCGDPYLGEKKPSNCPFCGASQRYLVLQKKYDDRIWEVKNLSETSKDNLVAALDLEVNATRIYTCSSNCAKTNELKNLFKALAKIESEHVSLLSKALGTTKPAIEPPEENICSNDDKENIVQFQKLEEKAAKVYGKYLSEAVEPRVQEIFTALIQVESDHLDIANKKLG